jgi:D-threo-aldose 1-dehydrogenase
MALSFPVPRLALGTAPLGSSNEVFGLDVSDDDARATLEHCVSSGIRYIDTAPLYGDGLAETRIGHVLRESAIPRGDLILSSKVGWLPDRRERIYTREAILRSIEGSLRRLRTDYLDIAHVHDPDLGDFRAQVLDEAFPTLMDLKKQGVVRAVGAGMNQWQMLHDFATHAEVDCFLLAGRYSLLEQDPLETFFPLVLRKKIAIVLGGIYNSGILATGAVAGARYNYAPAPEPVLRKTRQIEDVCRKYEVPLRAAALQFAAAHPAIQTLVLGMVTPSQLDDNLALLQHPIPSAFWQELRLENLIDLGAPTPS